MLKVLLISLLVHSMDCKPSPSLVDVVCTESQDGFPVFLPHPSSCGLYYMCEGTHPHLMSCPPGLNFDISLNVCSYVACQDKETTEHDDEEIVTDGIEEQPEGSEDFTTTETVTEEPTSTDEIFVNTTTGIIGTATDITDISVETTTMNSDTTEIVVETTTDIIVLNTTTEIPDSNSTTNEPIDTTTAASLNTTISGTTTTTPTKTTRTTSSSLNTTPTTAASFDVVCPDSADGLTVFVPHPEDCSLFYVCHGSTPVLMECPPGLVFDPSLSVCNYPHVVDCV